MFIKNSGGKMLQEIHNFANSSFLIVNKTDQFGLPTKHWITKNNVNELKNIVMKLKILFHYS